MTRRIQQTCCFKSTRMSHEEVSEMEGVGARDHCLQDDQWRQAEGCARVPPLPWTGSAHPRGQGCYLRIWPAVFLNRGCLLQANDGASPSVATGVLFNMNVCVVAREEVRIGTGAPFGLNARVCNHGHVFDLEGVYAKFRSTSRFHRRALLDRYKRTRDLRYVHHRQDMRWGPS